MVYPIDLELKSFGSVIFGVNLFLEMHPDTIILGLGGIGEKAWSPVFWLYLIDF